ncbi:MAG: hypothetical protein ABI402_14595 [Ferruginibacter sp.]
MINNFDDHIKKQFGNYKPEVPPHIWENIVAQKEQKKPGGFLFFLRNNRFALILLLFIATGAGALMMHNIYKNNTKENGSTGELSLSTTTNTKDQNNFSNDTKKETKEGTKTQEDKSNNNTAASSTVQNVKSNNDVYLLNSSNADAQTQTATNNKKTVFLPAGSQQNNVNNKNTGTKTSHVILSKSTNNADLKNKVAQYALPNNNTDAVNNNPLSTKNKTKRSAGKSAIAIHAPSPETTDAIQDVIPDATTTAVNANEIPIENRYLNLNTKPAEKTFLFSVKGINLPHLNIPCPGGKNGNGNHYFEIYGGPDYAFRSFNDTANSTYLKKRKESTHVSSAFSFGLRYTKVFNNGISFRAGINYSQVNEKFKFEQGHVVQLVYTINEYGDTTGSYATTGTRYKTTHNRYRTIDIPLVAGYEIGNDRLRANFNAGLVVNAYSWQRGDVLDSAYQPVNITTGKSSSAYQFKTNVGLGITGGISVYYRLTRKMYFLAEPYFRYNFSAANKADITLKQKYTTLGLRLGLRIDF